MIKHGGYGRVSSAMRRSSNRISEIGSRGPCMFRQGPNSVEGWCTMGFVPPGCWKGTFVGSGQLQGCEWIEMEWRLEEGLTMVISGGVDGMEMEMEG